MDGVVLTPHVPKENLWEQGDERVIVARQPTPMLCPVCAEDTFITALVIERATLPEGAHPLDFDRTWEALTTCDGHVLPCRHRISAIRRSLRRV